MSTKLRNFLKLVSYLLAMVAGGTLTSCNFMNMGPTIF